MEGRREGEDSTLWGDTAQNLNERTQVSLLLLVLTLNLLCQEAKVSLTLTLCLLTRETPAVLSVTNKKIRKTLQEAVHPCRFRDLTLTKSSPKPKTWRLVLPLAADKTSRHAFAHTHMKSFVSKTLQNGTIYWALKQKCQRSSAKKPRVRNSLLFNC